MTAFSLGNFANSFLEEAIGISDTEIVISSADIGAFPSVVQGSDHYVPCVVWDGTETPPEIVYISDNDGVDTFTVLRAQESTAAAAWPSGSIIRCVQTAAVITDLQMVYDQLAQYDLSNVLDDSVVTALIADDAITEDQLADDAVTTDKIEDLAVTADKMAWATITNGKIANGTIQNAKLASNAVATANIQDGAVTAAKLDSGAVFPPGTIVMWPTMVIPTGWLYCNGQEVSRTTYADLFAEIGTDYGVGDGSTTFELPDCRGYFIRGLDDGAGRDPTGSRVVGSLQQDKLEDHTHDLTELAGSGASNGLQQLLAGASAGTETSTGPTPAGTSETRPINMALLFIIKT